MNCYRPHSGDSQADTIVHSAARPSNRRRIVAIAIRMPVAFLLAFGFAMLWAQTGGQAVTAALIPNPLFYSTGFLVNGDYAVGSVDITGATNYSATATIPMSGVPADADILAAFLYWETIAPSWATPAQIANFVTFRGKPINAVRVKSAAKPLSGSTGSCFTSSGSGPLTMTMFRADVLALLPPQTDSLGVPTGHLLVNDADLLAYGLPLHTATLPEADSGNTIPDTAGATLVVVYKKASLPLKKIVVHDGIYIQKQGETTVQTIGGFYKSDPNNLSGKITHIVGAGADNTSDVLTITTNAGSSSMSNPFPSSSKSSDRSWAAVTFNLTKPATGPGAGKLPGKEIAPYGETITSTVSHTKSTPYECLSWAGTWASFSVLDADHDGIPDKLEDSPTPLVDPNGVQLPDIYKIEGNPAGGGSSRKHLLIEVNAMRTLQDTTYGAAVDAQGHPAPYDSSKNVPPPWAKSSVVTGTQVAQVTLAPHNHMPTPDVLKMIGDAYKKGGITAIFDVGDRSAYKTLGSEYALDVADEYLMPLGHEYERGGELTTEVACNATNPTCHFPAYPGTIGWGLSLQQYMMSPSAAPKFDPIREGLFHYLLFAHSRGKPKSLPCLDAHNVPINYEDGTTSCQLVPGTNTQRVNPTFRAEDYHVTTSSSGVSDLPGFRAVVSLGRWDYAKGTAFMQASTTFHEIGHNLDRWHGGDGPTYTHQKDSAGKDTPKVLTKIVEANCKPNYFSSMSYLFQVFGLHRIGDKQVLDYAGLPLPALNEATLRDGSILPEGNPGNLPYRAAWFVPLAADSNAQALGLPAATKFCSGVSFGTPGFTTPSTPMARYEASTLSATLNWNTAAGNTAFGQDINLDGTAPAVLNSFNDWTNLRLDAMSGGHLLGDTSNGGQDYGGQDYGGQDYGGQDYGGQDYGGQDYGGQTISNFGGQDYGGQDYGGLDRDGQDYGGQDYGGQDYGGDGELTYEGAAAMGNPGPSSLTACVIGPIGTETPAQAEARCPGGATPLHRIRLRWTPPTVGTPYHNVVIRFTGEITPEQVSAATQKVFVGRTLDGATTTLVDNEELPDNQKFTYYVYSELSNETLSDPQPQGEFSAPRTKSLLSDFATVTAVNSPAIAILDPPVAAPDSYAMNEDTVLSVSAPGVLLNDDDPDSPKPTSGVVLVLSPANAAAFSLNSNGSFTYTPKRDFFGIDSFTYKIVAPTWGTTGIPLSPDSNITTVTIRVDPVNDVPAFTKGADDTVLEDSGARSVANWATPIPAPYGAPYVGFAGPANETNPAACTPAGNPVCNQVVNFIVSNTNNALFSAQPAIAANGTLTYTPAPNANGSAVVTVQVHDNGGTANGGVDTSAPQTFNITVTRVNDPPAGTANTVTTLEDNDYTFAPANFGFTDPNDALPIAAAGPNLLAGVKVTTLPAAGSLKNNGTAVTAGQEISVADLASGKLKFSPAANANGSAYALFTFQVRDDGGTANAGIDVDPSPKTMTIDVTPVNDPPSFTKGANQSVGTTAGAQSVPNWATAISAGPNESQTLNFIVSNDSPSLFTANGQPAVSPTGTLTYTPAGTTGSATVTVTLHDNGGTANGGSDTSASQTFTIDVDAVATTYVVTNTNDSGVGSLRQAINGSNANPGVTNTITFNIPGPAPHIIAPASQLPAITVPVVIDGTTQPGFTVSGPLVVTLTGASMPGGGTGLLINSGNSTVRGLTINGFTPGSGISLQGPGGNTIQGNRIGTAADGATAIANQYGIDINAPDTLVGGTSAADRNLFSGNTVGINVSSGGTGTLIEGNYVGLNAAGNAALPNGTGIAIGGSGHKVGGATANARNVISGNTGIGITLGGSNTAVVGNYIGTNAAGTAAVGNGVGIDIGGTNNTVGGSYTGVGNVIAGNGVGVLVDNTGNFIVGNTIGATGLANSGDGVKINQGQTIVQRNAIANNGGSAIEVAGSATNNSLRFNSISANGFGIALSASHPTVNDSGDGDTGPNQLQNYPVLTNALVNGSVVTIAGTLNSTPSTTFTVDFYASSACDATGYGQGSAFLGSNPSGITTDLSGNASFTALITSGIAVATKVTATATDSNGNTSEFSQCVSAEASSAPTAYLPGPGDLVISEFRASGPGGATDQFVEIYNNTDHDIAAGGVALVEEGGFLLLTIPSDYILPSRGHWIGTNINGSSTSVTQYGQLNTTRTQGVNAWGFDGHQYATNNGLALFTSNISANWTLANRLDAVGRTTSDPLYRTGTGLPVIGPDATAHEYAWVRRMSGFSAQNTGVNASDFMLVSTDAGPVGGVAAARGAISPETNGEVVQSPRYGNVPGSYGLYASVLDPLAPASSAPNQVSVGSAIVLRRVLTNNTGGPISRIRIKLTDLSTDGARTSSEANLQVVSADDEPVVATASGVVAVKGMILEQPPNQPSGGGINSSLTAVLAAPLQDGESIAVAIKFTVTAGGTLRMGFDVPIPSCRLPNNSACQVP